MPRRAGKQGSKKNGSLPGCEAEKPLIPEPKESQIQTSWAPWTPVKPILLKQPPICTDEQTQENWLIPQSFSQEPQIQKRPACCELRNSIDKNENFNVSFANLIALADAAAVTRAPVNSTQCGSSPFSYTINSQSATSSLANQSISFGHDLWNSSSSALDTYFYGNSISFQPAYDLNSQPKALPETVSSVNIPSQFAPVTPDNSKKAKNKKACDLQNPKVDERTIQAQDKQSTNIAPRVEVEELQHGKEQEHLPKDLSCVEGSTQLQENHNPDKGGDPGIDLNKTPQQRRRRKKYTPKVVVEGKPKRTPKPATPKPANSKEKPTGKRKYVRKNKVEKSPSTPAVEETSRGSEPNEEPPPAAQSCRRKLNFDSENQVREESSSCRPQSNDDAESQAQNFCTRVESQSTVQLGQVEKTDMGIAYDLAQSMNKVLEDYISMPERQTPSPQTPAKTDQLHEKLKAHVEDKCRRGSCRITFSEETHDKQGSPMQKMMKTDLQWAPNSPGDANCSSSTCLTEEQAKGLKRGYLCRSDEVQHISTNVVGCHYSSLHEYLTNIPEDLYNNGMMGMCFPAHYKKKRTEKRHNSTTLSILPTMAPTKSSVQQGMAPPLNNKCSAPYAPDISCRFSANQFNTSCIEAQGKQQMLEREQALNQKRTRRKISKNPTQVQNLPSLVGIVQYRQLPNCPSEGAPKHKDMLGYEISHYPNTCKEALSADTHAMTTKKRTKRNSSGSSVTTGAIQKRISHVDEIVEQIRSLSINSESKTFKNQTPNSLIPCGLRYEEQNAIVLYQRDGTVVPFEGSFDPIWRRRRPRPKVDLDDETTRVWKLLLENINGEGIDGTDEEKAKWWEEERRVFRGRADSFIARMHLVQGDRRFSPWKGSVLDSVIGVFLTQNVSDHLSSSAFMSLAAQFPLKPDRNSMTCSKETNILAKEPEMCILDPENIIKWHEDKLNQPASDRSSMTLHDMDYNVEKVVNSNELLQSSSGSERSSDNLKCRFSDIPGNGLTIPSFMREKRENDVLSSQCSAGSSQNTLDSSMVQTAERKELQQENLEADLEARSSGLVGASFLELLQRAETFNGLNENGHNFREGTGCGTQKQNKEVSVSSKASSRPIAPSNNYHLHMISNSRELGVESIEMVGEESLSSNHCRKNEENCTSEQSGVTAESVSQSVVQKNLIVSLKEAPNSMSENNHSCSNCRGEENKFIGIQNWPDGDPKDSVESQTQGHSCIMQQALDMTNLSRETLDARESTSVIDSTRNIEHKEVVSSLKDHGCLPGKTNSQMSSDSSKVKRGSTGKKKQKIVDWDSLRLQAQANGRTRERTANTMDSLDWEAVRCADVNDIADTIKARGMNNVLAERIKDFLNRMIREHGSIDLEWLRDVPPDKAKEYLLSIRGLGLKSVECVRLLTLHHLAFPVDTNVGRIAVRLGWVPLQPLPESLQLHLLELYPVLESIQKYLWPRLCKLDQRTLYELHYQMITFGKVFCTKSKPNCNACPMRGECRHFASAFASARLALPGPEERSIVSATEDKAPNQNPVQVMKPLQPLPQGSQQLQMQAQINRCEPIVEEPATPEPIIEVPTTPELEQPVVPEHDIEDAFCEDPEEIPTIKLNIEVFTQNLQNYMQQNMEIQGGDMCKALVALNPEVASIPTPKLKNVSRLRTEHQVYELPDSHPLLEGLDKREPDDPCSYLLAIWTPGETASSIQPPERKCSSQEFGRLCDDDTCFSCNSIREANSQTVRGTLLIPCRTAMRGSFPLNGTYFQVNEVFADHESSINPIDVPRSWIWNLPRRTVYFGTSIPTIFKGLSTESIQHCFWRGFVCVRGFDQKTRAPRPLMARLHFPASKLTRTRGNNDEKLE